MTKANEIIIHENFYEDPYAIRENALSQPYSRRPTGLYSERKIYTEQQESLFQKLTNENIVAAKNSFCGYFKITSELIKYEGVHTDTNPNDMLNRQVCWAGICHLSLPEHYENKLVNDSSTKFWKHKKFGLTEIPETLEKLQESGVNSTSELVEMLRQEGNTVSSWELINSIPVKFNRLILFRPWVFHSVSRSFGTTKHNSRLVQLFFFEYGD